MRMMLRILGSIVGALLICGIGWVALVGSIHRTYPVLRAVQWVTLPLVTFLLDHNSEFSDVGFWLAVLSSVALWSIVLNALLTLWLRLWRGAIVPGGKSKTAP